MSQVDLHALARPIVRTLVVPAAIYNAASRANLNLMDLTVFGKLRKVASLEDIAVYVALNNSVRVGGQRISTHNLEHVLSLGDGIQAEMDVVVHQLCKNAEVLKLSQSVIQEAAGSFSDTMSIRTSLGAAVQVESSSIKNTLSADKLKREDSTYQLKTSGSNVFVVVSSGFSKYLGAQRGNEEADKFIRDFLTHCSGMFSASEVARHPLFKTFLHSFAVNC